MFIFFIFAQGIVQKNRTEADFSNKSRIKDRVEAYTRVEVKGKIGARLGNFHIIGVRIVVRF